MVFCSKLENIEQDRFREWGTNSVPPDLETQSDEFSWAKARRNLVVMGLYVATALPVAILVIELPNLASKDVRWFFEFAVLLPVFSFLMLAAFGLLLQRYEWWWNKKWSIEPRRKYLTSGMTGLMIYPPLLYSPLRDWFFNSEADYPVLVIFLFYSLCAFVPARYMGLFLSWLTLVIVAAMRTRTRLTAKLHSFFWRDSQ